MADESTGDVEAGELPLDEILELLSQYQRRAIVRYLAAAPAEELGIDEVIDHLAAVERGRGGDVPGEDHLLSVLVHVHGPRLEAADVIDYDGQRKVVRYHPNERVELALDRIDDLVAEL